MDVLYVIKSDHDEIRSSFAKLEAADGVKNRRSRLEELARALHVHLTIEKDYLYPEITGLFPGSETVVDVGAANAAAIVRRLKALTKLASKPLAEQAGYDKRFDELRTGVFKHFEAEEQALMPKMREMIRTEEREDLGQVFLDVKEEVAKSLDGEVTAGSGSRKRA